MKALIIDDHKINRLYLKSLLEKNFPVFKEINETETVAGAIAQMQSIEYDLIFLDMELKDGMGFDVLKVVKDFLYVIVVTSHKEYAVQAFKHNVMDYLLKPINIIEFKNAVKKVLRVHQREEVPPPTPTLEKHSDFNGVKNEVLMINYKNQFVTVDKKDILFIRALGKYSEIHVASKNHYTSYKNLKEFEIAMTDIFIRIHHSYLVNFKSIISYSRETSQVLLTNGVEIPVSVRKREELFKKFKVF